MQLYALALGAVVQSGIDEWLRSTGTVQAEIEGDRPNCLAAGFGYKARPLNGVWATAPFLHNGSVPTIYDLLSPVAERPQVFLLGEPSFDPVRVGIVTRTVAPEGRTYDSKGYFIIDTSRPANRNTGHEFSNEKHDVGGLRGRSRAPARRSAQTGPTRNVPPATVSPDVHTKSRRQAASVSDRGSRRQNRPGGHRHRAQRHLRRRLLWLFLRVSARQRTTCRAAHQY